MQIEFKLYPLPCGCVVDARAHFTYITGGVVECPWCSSSFDVREWVRWMKTPDAAPLPVAQSRKLVHFGYAVAELVDEVNVDGKTLIRDCGNGYQTLVPIDFLQLAWN